MYHSYWVPYALLCAMEYACPCASSLEGLQVTRLDSIKVEQFHEHDK